MRVGGTMGSAHAEPTENNKMVRNPNMFLCVKFFFMICSPHQII